MTLDGVIVRCQPASRADSKTKNENFFNGDDVKVAKTAVKLPIRVTNFVSQKQLPDTLHSKANVISFYFKQFMAE